MAANRVIYVSGFINIGHFIQNIRDADMMRRVRDDILRGM